MRKVGGTLSFLVGGVVYLAKGEFTIGGGGEKREPVMGTSGPGPQGYSAEWVAPTIEGAITNSPEVDWDRFFDLEDTDVTLVLGDQTFLLRGATYTGDRKMTTGEGEIAVMFAGDSLENVRA